MNAEPTFPAIPADDAPLLAPDRRRGRRRTIIFAVIIAALALAAAAYAFNRNKEGAVATGASSTAAGKGGKAGQIQPVTVIVPGRTTIAGTINATGTLAARRELPVGVAGEGGMIGQVMVEPGQWVAAGQTLAVIDRRVQEQQANALAAQIGVAESDAALAQGELDRANALIARGFISKADVQRKSAARDAANARVRVARAQLAQAQASTSRLDIRAPAAGLVLTRAVEPGQVVSAGSGVLFRIAKGGELELRALVGETDLSRLSVGLPATITPVGSTQAYQGQIWQLAPVIDPQTRQGTARIAVPYNAALRPGGFAAAQITSGTVVAPLLPESAVQHDDKGSFVMVVDDRGKVQRRDVKVGRVDNSGVPVTDGLSGQEQVVLSAGAFLNPGETVKPVRTTVAAATADAGQ